MLEGEISQINLIERLVELWREQFTGAIRFENDGVIKIIYFKGGDVLSASTNDRADSIDEILMRAGKVSREHVKQALARRKESETLGDAMLNLGYITRKELTWARRVQVVGVIRSIAAWTQGTFNIVADYLPKRDEGTLFPLPQVLVELIVTEQDRARFDRALDGGNAVFSKASDFDEVFRRLGLNEDADAIVAHIDGSRSASEIAATSGRDAFNVYKLLDALATLRILTREDKPQAEPQFSLEDEFSAVGVTDAAPMWEQETPAIEPQTFELDEVAAAGQPTLEIPSTSLDTPPARRSAWDEEEEEESPALPPPPISMPAWDIRPPAMAAPIPVPVEPAAEAEEEQWGFDDAQIETARLAAEPVVPPPVKIKEGGRRFGFILALLLIFILAGGGYAGFVYWQKLQEKEGSIELVERQPVQPSTAAPTPAETGTIVPVTTDTTTTTTAPPEPMIITAPPVETAPPPAVATAGSAPPQPLPAVVPRGDARSRYDAMARDFAANPRGNFTVQIQILCEPSNLEKAIRAGGDNVWFVPQQIGARSCYRVFWGRYATREDAQRALAQVPATLRDANSAVKAVPRG